MWTRATSIFVFSFLILAASPSWAQWQKAKLRKKEKEKELAIQQKEKERLEKMAADTSSLSVADDYKPTLELNPGVVDEDKRKAKKKKRKKKVFYGVKTKKRYTKRRQRNAIVIEKFHILKEYREPNAFIDYVYFYNQEKRQIDKTLPQNYKLEMGIPLHGLYERTIDGELMEKGLYYFGAKDGRWELYGSDKMLLDKEYFYKGFPKKSEISYYDKDQQKIKEVVPMQYGKKNGTYMYYYESGRLAEHGVYVDGIKVGKWYEFYDRNRPNIKKVTAHRSIHKPYDDEFVTYVELEYDEKGNKLVDERKRAGQQ